MVRCKSQVISTPNVGTRHTAHGTRHTRYIYIYIYIYIQMYIWWRSAPFMRQEEGKEGRKQKKVLKNNKHVALFRGRKAHAHIEH